MNPRTIAWTAALLLGGPGGLFAQAAPPAPPTLREVLEIALRRNPDIEAARAQVDSAHGEQRIARALPNPLLSSAPNHPWQYPLTLPLDVTPQRLFRTRAASRGTDAAVDDATDVERQVKFGVRQAFLDVLLAEEREREPDADRVPCPEREHVTLWEDLGTVREGQHRQRKERRGRQRAVCSTLFEPLAGRAEIRAASHGKLSERVCGNIHRPVGQVARDLKAGVRRRGPHEQLQGQPRGVNLSQGAQEAGVSARFLKLRLCQIALRDVARVQPRGISREKPSKDLSTLARQIPLALRQKHVQKRLSDTEFHLPLHVGRVVDRGVRAT